MSICWYCHWGWPKPVADIYKKALKDLDGYDFPLTFGPGHVVWSDENWELAQMCLDTFDEHKGDYSDEELAIVRRSLEELIALPQSVWDVEPEEYDGENPELFPPPAGIEMVKGL